MFLTCGVHVFCVVEESEATVNLTARFLVYVRCFDCVDRYLWSVVLGAGDRVCGIGESVLSEDSINVCGI